MSLLSLFKAIASAFFLLSLGGCTPTPERFQASKDSVRYIPTLETPFADYIIQTKKSIQTNRVDLAPNTPLNDAIVLANSPFQYEPNPELCKNQNGSFKYKQGILLIHGFLGSPYTMQEIGKFFRDRCFLVRSILLPGHGTRPGDLLNIHYQDWIDSVNYGVRSFENKVENLYLAGYSLGGTLALHHVISQKSQTHKSLDNLSSPIKGLFLFSPALKLNSNLASFAGIVSHFLDWGSKTSEGDYAAYESFSYQAVAQTVKLIDQNNHHLKNINNLSVPVFIALSATDATVDSKYTVKVFRQQMNKAPNHMQLYTTQPKMFIQDQRIQGLQSQLEQESILSFSHTSILVPQQHPHYGFNGDYRRCLHYSEQTEEWLACKNSLSIPQAETNYNSTSDKIRQLTYNPYFNKMLDAMEGFLEAVENP